MLLTGSIKNQCNDSPLPEGSLWGVCGGGGPVLELEALEQVYLDVGVPQAALPVWEAGATRWHAGAGQGRLKPLDGDALYDANTGLWLLRYQADNPDRALRDGAWIQAEHLGAPQPVVWVPRRLSWRAMEKPGVSSRTVNNSNLSR